MKHVLSVTVEDKPGVLARISSMCAQRGFNIHSLAVGPIHQPGLSRITLVVDGHHLEQVTKQLHKLVNVLKINELHPDEALEREIMLVRVAANPDNRRQVKDSAEVFGADTIDLGANSITFQVADTPRRLAEFLELMEHYGVVDLVKSGRIALSRDVKSHNAARNLKSVS